MNTDAPKPERKRRTVPAPKPRAVPPLLVRAGPAREENRIAYARWLVGCGMEARAAARAAATADAGRIASTLGALRALEAARAKAKP